ncbi:hypothetical protein YC2023_062715 [Brassica napus]
MGTGEDRVQVILYTAVLDKLDSNDLGSCNRNSNTKIRLDQIRNAIVTVFKDKKDYIKSSAKD